MAGFDDKTMGAQASEVSADTLTAAIQNGVRAEVERIAAEEIEAAQRRVAERSREVLDRVALSVLAHYDLAQDGKHILIRVDKRELR